MPLDPKIQQVLKQATAPAGTQGLMLSVEAARNGLIRASVAQVLDRRIDGPGGPLPVRVYTPAGAGPFPVFVFFHGGGWVTGNLDTHDGFCRIVSDWAECIVVAVDYRTAPEHRFPAAVDDCVAAMIWVADHAPELRGDPARIAVGGGGSGGNLAAVVAQTARDRGAPRLSYQILLYPVVDCGAETDSRHEFGHGYGLSRQQIAWFLDHYVPSDVDRTDVRLSPLRAKSFSGLPPALVITAEYDPLRDEGNAYARRLRDEGVTVQHEECAGMIHGFLNMPALLDQGKYAILRCTVALRAGLSPRQG